MMAARATKRKIALLLKPGDTVIEKTGAEHPVLSVDNDSSGYVWVLFAGFGSHLKYASNMYLDVREPEKLPFEAAINALKDARRNIPGYHPDARGIERAIEILTYARQ